MKNIILGIIIGIVGTLGGAYIFLTSGGMPVSTKKPPLPLEAHIAKKAIHAAVKDHEDTPSPIPADEANLLAGVKTYRANCAVCHGLPGHDGSLISMGLQPEPPWFFDAGANQGVEDDPVGEIYWFVSNGIRLTGMPGFQGNLTDEQMWQVAQVLKVGKAAQGKVKEALAAP